MLRLILFFVQFLISFVMQKLQGHSLSKSLLIATPLFCLVLALLDSSDELSYLFVLQFLGNVAGSADLLFIPTAQPQTSSFNFQRDQALARAQIQSPSLPSAQIPLVDYATVQNWARSHPVVKGISPRWLIPVELPKTDSLLLVANITKELEIGVGMKSGLQPLGQNEIAVSSELMSKLGVGVGQRINVKLSLSNLLQGGKLIEKYQSFQSKDEYVVDSQQKSIEQLSITLADMINQRGAEFNLSVKPSEVQKVLQEIYDYELDMDFMVKYQYNNNGLYSSTLHNVVLIEFSAFVNILQKIVTNVIESKQFEKTLFDEIGKTGLPKEQVLALRTYFKLTKSSAMYRKQLKDQLTQAVTSYPLLVIASYNNRQLIYHPSQSWLEDMTVALQSTPGSMQVVSILPFFKDLEGIRFFFKSVIQIFTFICAVLYFYILQLTLTQVYEQKQVEVGIWRTLGAGGIRLPNSNTHQNAQIPGGKVQPLPLLTLREKARYAYQMMVKVGFLYYWLASSFFSALLYLVAKHIIYSTICRILLYSTPPQPLWLPIVLFFALFFLTTGLSCGHILRIYNNPLVETMQPVKRTFDVVKVRIVQLATFGLSSQGLLIGVMLVYYGVVSYYWIPVSILYNDGWLQTTLFNSIFLFMIFGSIVLLTVLQTPAERGILRLLFRLSLRLNRLKLILLKSLRAKQYRNTKVSIVIAVIFAFILFFSAGIRIEMQIVQSFIQRQLGASLVMQNYEKTTFDRPLIQAYLNSQPVKYAWLSNNINSRNLTLKLYSIVSKASVKADFKVVSPHYLDATYSHYYYPQQYIETDRPNYQTLSNGISNGFNSIYTYDRQGNNRSVGRYDPADTLTVYDPHQINLNITSDSSGPSLIMAPQEQVIELAVTSFLRKNLGASAGDYYKLTISNGIKKYFLRCRIVHSFKIGPGLDLFRPIAFLSEEQAAYLFRIMEQQTPLKYEKLFVSGSDLSGVGAKILSLSPEHTQMFQMGVVRQSFELLQTYLAGFIVVVTVILASLSVLFLSLYTLSKCREQASVFKMLRAVGLPVPDIRLMVFLEIFLRVIVAIFSGIVLGIIFSLGLSAQIEQVLMINTPALQLRPVLIIAVILLLLFGFTVSKSTRYLQSRTVLETAKG